MTVLAVAALILLFGSLFVLVELVGAPVGFEDATGFHAVSKTHASGGTLRKAKPSEGVHTVPCVTH